ncbi:hypothetical protein F4825DRAFT_446128 [Nemania diffusa]|nr:hypothetical protein F4825DRAFT_446128 [Nemania diffusa]
MSNRNQDIAMRRRELQTQYNAIEGATISSLFRSRTNIWRWSKMALLRGVMLEHENLKDEFRNAIAEKISTVVALRKEIMPLWPVSADAETTHLQWINTLQRIIRVLRTTDNTADVEKRRKIIESTPVAIVEDERPWADVDMDIYLKQMGHWRKNLVSIWETAMDDPKQMSIADISTARAVWHFKVELAEMELCNVEWYNKSGEYKPETLYDMSKVEPDGFGGELFRIFESVREKSLPDIEKELENTKLDGYGFPRVVKHRWLLADRSRHANPLIDWVSDVIKRTRKVGDTRINAEFLLAWLLISDSKKMAKDHIQRLQSASVKRLLDVVQASRIIPAVFGDKSYGVILDKAIAQRVRAMNKYVMKQETVPSLAIAHTWADHLIVMINIFLFNQPALKMTAFLLDANMILKRWQNVPAAPEAEQFCNRFAEYLYPQGRRPKTEDEWKMSTADWLAGRPENVLQLDKKLGDYSMVERSGRSWERIEVIEEHLTLKPGESRITRGTEKWWQAVKTRATEELQSPSIVPMLHKIDTDLNLELMLDIIYKLEGCDWEKEETKVEETLARFEVPSDWFDGVLG